MVIMFSGLGINRDRKSQRCQVLYGNVVLWMGQTQAQDMYNRTNTKHTTYKYTELVTVMSTEQRGNIKLNSLGESVLHVTDTSNNATLHKYNLVVCHQTLNILYIPPTE